MAVKDNKGVKLRNLKKRKDMFRRRSDEPRYMSNQIVETPHRKPRRRK